MNVEWAKEAIALFWIEQIKNRTYGELTEGLSKGRVVEGFREDYDRHSQVPVTAEQLAAFYRAVINMSPFSMALMSYNLIPESSLHQAFIKSGIPAHVCGGVITVSREPSGFLYRIGHNNPWLPLTFDVGGDYAGSEDWIVIDFTGHPGASFEHPRFAVSLAGDFGFGSMIVRRERVLWAEGYESILAKRDPDQVLVEIVARDKNPYEDEG